MRLIVVIGLVAALLSACAPPPGDTPTNNLTPGVPPPYAPQPGDENLSRGEVFLDSAEILVMESFPLQFSVNLKGNLPTPCHQLRALVSAPDGQNQIELELYSLADPNAVCIQVLEPFQQSIYLGSFPSGHYTVVVDQQVVAEFDA